MNTKSVEIPGQCEDPRCGAPIDVRTLCCIVCGVSHSEPCHACGRFGFHRDDCAEMRPAELARPRIICGYCDLVQDPGTPGAEIVRICCRACWEKCVPGLPYPEVQS